MNGDATADQCARIIALIGELMAPTDLITEGLCLVANISTDWRGQTVNAWLASLTDQSAAAVIQSLQRYL